MAKLQHSANILVADDEYDFRMILESFLVTEGHTITTAEDGADAINKLQEKPFDLVLLDIRMPRVDGIEVLQYIKQQYIDTQVIILTAVNDVRIAVECMKLGAFHFLTKPYSVDELSSLVNRALELRAMAILEFLSLTNYHYDFGVHVKSQNSITSVARRNKEDFAMVFTSGITPYTSDEVSGPTEKFIRNYGTRVHHMAFQTEKIEETVAQLKKEGMEFLLELVGSDADGLKQIFSEPSPHTLIVNEYIHRYGNFDGFFSRSNVEKLTEATAKQ
jgi:CheY-like chemotaxis protein